jgi:phosphoglycolate phosphatase-like HAD superfamily hydrolase
LDVFKNKYDPSEIVFIGDRGVDMDFAKNAGFHFINAKEINF